MIQEDVRERALLGILEAWQLILTFKHFGLISTPSGSIVYLPLEAKGCTRWHAQL